MTIEFEYNHEGRYLLVTYRGRIAPGEIPSAWTDFIEKDYRRLGYNLLADLSRADMSAVPMEDVERLSEITCKMHEEHGISTIKVANYAWEPLPFGMARAYEGMAIGSIEEVRAFKDLEEAKAWITGKEIPPEAE